MLDRDEWRCRACGRPGRLEVDHIQPLDRNPEQDAFDPGGLQTLCRGCHIEKTRRENTKEVPEEVQAWRDRVAELLQDS